MENKKIKISGIVCFSGKIEDKTILSIIITEQQKELIHSLIENYDAYESTPLKIDSDTEKICFKSNTSFTPNIYEDDIESELDVTDIGVDSEVVIQVHLKETTYKRKKYVSAYLKAINILHLEEATKYNPFLDDEAEEI